jgi:hypothetical protein
LATQRARERLARRSLPTHGLTKIVAVVGTGRLTGAAKRGVRVGKVIGRYKMARHYTLDTS